MFGSSLVFWANGYMNNENRMGLNGQPCRHAHSKEIVFERLPFILMKAVGGLYNAEYVLIMQLHFIYYMCLK